MRSTEEVLRIVSGPEETMVHIVHVLMLPKHSQWVQNCRTCSIWPRPGLAPALLLVPTRELLASPCLSSSWAFGPQWTASAAPAAEAAGWWSPCLSSPCGQMPPPAARAGPAPTSSFLQGGQTEGFLLRGRCRLPSGAPPFGHSPPAHGVPFMMSFFCSDTVSSSMRRSFTRFWYSSTCRHWLSFCSCKCFSIWKDGKEQGRVRTWGKNAF